MKFTLLKDNNLMLRSERRERLEAWQQATPILQYSGRLQPPDLRLELEAQLRAFLVGQPVRHLRKDGAIEQNRLRFPWQLLCRASLGENLVEFGAYRVGIGPVFGRGGVLAERSDCSSGWKRSG